MKHTVFLFTFLFFVVGLIFSAPKAYAYDFPESVPSDVSEQLNETIEHFNIDFTDDWGYLYFIGQTVQGDDSPRVMIFPDKTKTVEFGTNRLVYDNNTSSLWYLSYCSWTGDPLSFITSYDGTFYSSSNGSLYGNIDSSLVSIGSFFSDYISIDSTQYGSVDSISNAGLLARMYDITFTPTISFPANSSLLNQSFKAVPVAVRDDTGYNVISLQVPQLGAYADTIFYGQFHLKPHFTSSEYYFNSFKMSFGSDPLNENDDIYDDTITSDMFHLLVDINGTVSVPSSKIMTVNSLSFFYNTKIQDYSNREFVIFDYSSDDDNLYPDFRFEGIGSINIYSAGTIVYNCDFSGLFDVSENAPATPDKVKKLSDEGNDDSSDTVDTLGYIPRDVSYPDFNQGFDIGNPDIPDFSVLGNIFSFMFENRVIRVMLINCLLVGLAGFVLYGKKGGG